mmetsp:Transcript_27667/g.33829  ORF Transcript_27667/g.33829 Transcript_27667/m.33829 type:complete len:139 (-) Transcript_27667:227-643(-)
MNQEPTAIMAHVCPFLELHDDALDALLMSCDVISIGRIAQTCRRLSNFCTLEPNRTHWKRNLMRRLDLPHPEIWRTPLPPDSYRSLLRTALRTQRMFAPLARVTRSPTVLGRLSKFGDARVPQQYTNAGLTYKEEIIL